MQIRAIPEDGAVRLVVQGELDLVGASDLMDAMEAIECPAAVVLDLRPVTFLDSAGLRAILAARSDRAGRPRRVTVVQGPRQVERVLELAGVDQIVDVVRHPAQARPALALAPSEDAAPHPLARWSSFRTAAPFDGDLPG